VALWPNSLRSQMFGDGGVGAVLGYCRKLKHFF